MNRWKGSTSSVWGSANSHLGSDGQRRYSAMSSVSSNSGTPDSDVSLDTTSKSGPSAQLTGSRGVVCKTQAEVKANKLNRNEQTKLENIKFRVVKERELSQRKFSQSERSLRAKSAKLLGRIRNIESEPFTEAERPMSYSYEKEAKGRTTLRRPKSSPGSSDDHDHGRCELCDKIQKIICMYEGEHASVLNEVTNHSMCVFSDVQVKTFIHMLEAKYLDEEPDVSNKIHESGVGVSRTDKSNKASKKSREEINHTIARRNVQTRVQQFCTDIEKINKEECSIPKEVQDEVERKRAENAILMLQKAPPRHEQIIMEVKQMLKISL